MISITSRQALTFCAGLLLTACTHSTSNKNATGADTDTAAKASAITAVPDLGPAPEVPDTQFIIVDSMVNIKVNDQAVPRRKNAFDSTLISYWKATYARTQKLPAYVRFKYQGTVMMGARGNLMDAVVRAQDSLKDHIARDKYLQEFHKIDPLQQKEMEKKYPVLFQKQL
ncbi:MAG TPA: hypothetical protein VFS25_09330 [Chitinophaga sp.]|uniref:hypothetical protein n=1 Tax=Chitinophaga sp. TaxID=1869181 RepID=UPI002DB745AC|nr:hypothetical protein [Chitinophaga sp.]HEU4553025.1 hypothetical protein [Chitinophaga sp.]